tara:strand:+ start:11751 stop:13694 length:1944 start_codon:yes stop_codon:yes gene_type:complete
LFALSALLLKPILKYASISYEKPIILVGIDNSKSILLGKDSATYKSELANKIEELKSNLSAEFEVKTLLIGDEIVSGDKIDFSEKASNLSSFMDYVNDNYAYDNVSAGVLISDGIFNKATNPNYKKWNIDGGLYTVALGDSSQMSDQKLTNVRSNSIAFLGNKFPINVNLQIDGFIGQKSMVKIVGYGKEIYSQEIEITSNSLNLEFQHLADAEKVGLQKFTVKILSLEGELNTINNEQVFYVKVKDKRQKILMAYDFPHPDIAAIRRSIEDEESYEVKMYRTKDLLKLDKENIEENFNLIVAFQIPTGDQKSKKAFSLLRSCNTPQWYISSSHTDHLLLFNSDKGIEWKGQSDKNNSVQGSINANFDLFTITNDKGVQTEYPPVKVPFGVLNYSVGSQVLSFQTVSGIITQYPLWLFTSSAEGIRKSYFFGEGIWHWKMSEYEHSGTYDLFDETVTKTVQYLASKKDVSRFRVYCETSFYENDPIELNAEFYNLSYELINEPNVSVQVRNEEGDLYELEMVRKGSKYYLNVGKLSPGKFSYKASVNHQGKEMVKSGEFSVKKLDTEYKNLQADFNLMRGLAQKNGGKFYTYNKWDEFSAELKQKKAVQRSYEEVEIKDLIHQKWLFALLVLIIGLEWLIRKREGVI